MDKYRKHVKKLADAGSSELIANGGTEHAEVLIENIFAHANNKVRVFTGKLNARVYGSSNIVENAREFLQSDSGHKLQILVQDEEVLSTLKTHELIKMCFKLNADMCEIRSVGIEDRDVDHHFVVMDEIGYRFEPDRSKPTAVACFHDAEHAELLVKSFDEMFGRGADVDIMSQPMDALTETAH